MNENWVEGLAELPVKGALLHVGVELHLLKTARGADAFLVSGGDVTGRNGTGGAGLGAFQCDNFTRHGGKKGGG